jgi:protein disulfide-isomerase A6
MDEGCSKSSVCLLAFLPHISETGAKGRNNYLKTLKDIANKYKAKPVTYVWLEAGSQPALEELFGLGGFGYPSVVAMNAKKSRFALMRGSFSASSIGDFVNALTLGREKLSKFNELPALQPYTAWDGKDPEGYVSTSVDFDDEL